MKRKVIVEKAAGVSSDAVSKKTGKHWDAWIAILDRMHAARLSHKEIADWLINRYPEIGAWWAQMIAVGYEQERGLRKKHQKIDGFSASVTRTIAVPVEKLFHAWKDKRLRDKWLDGEMTIERAVENTSLRVSWDRNLGSVEVTFTSRNKDKSQVVVQQGALATAASVTRMKALWTAALNRLKTYLEGE